MLKIKVLKMYNYLVDTIIDEITASNEIINKSTDGEQFRFHTKYVDYLTFIVKQINQSTTDVETLIDDLVCFFNKNTSLNPQVTDVIVTLLSKYCKE